jgi:hypothetical protein
MKARYKNFSVSIATFENLNPALETKKNFSYLAAITHQLLIKKQMNK